MRRGSAVGLLAFALPALLQGAGAGGNTCPEHLLVIERSKNANVVVYDPNLGSEGEFAAAKPVVAYWLLNGETGKREELNAMEREHAYGFDVAPGETPGAYAMAFKAARQRRLTVRMLKGCPVVIGPIGSQSGILRRMFVQSKEGSLRPKVEYVEIFGEDAASGGALYEKFVPEK